MPTKDKPQAPCLPDEIPPAQLLSDLEQHLANMEQYSATCAAAGVQPEIDTNGPQHESMAQVIRRLGSGQCCTMSLRYLRAIVSQLRAAATAQELLKRTYTVFSRVGTNESLRRDIVKLIGPVEVPETTHEH